MWGYSKPMPPLPSQPPAMLSTDPQTDGPPGVGPPAPWTAPTKPTVVGMVGKLTTVRTCTGPCAAEMVAVIGRDAPLLPGTELVPR